MSNLQQKRQEIKKLILESSYKAGVCHIGSALSAVDILINLYYKILKKGDVFIFSKSSGIAALYCILADKGFFLKSKIAYYLKNYPLGSKKVPNLIWGGGSCGHGLSLAAGLALADRKRKVYVLLSDGELDEGSTYEAALFIHQHKLKNLYVIVDNNGYQACGAIKDILDLETAFEFYQKTIPNFKRVKTIKGAGIDFMENKYEWHYKNLDKTLLDKALRQII